MNIISFDTETRGLDWFDPDQAAFLVSWADANGEWTTNLLDWNERDRIVDVLQNANVIVAHNLSFDLHQIREQTGFDLLQWEGTLIDTDIISRVLYPAGQKGEYTSHGLKELSKVWLRDDADESEKVLDELAKSIGYKSGIKPPKTHTGPWHAYYDVWRAYPDELEHYAREDARLTYDLYDVFKSKLDGDAARCYELEQAVTPVLIQAEARGVKIDQTAVQTQRDHYTEQRERDIDYLKQELGEQALGGEGSEQALEEALLGLGIPLYRKTDSGKLATNQFALQEFEDDFPQIAKYQAYRQAEKFLSTYIGPMVGRDVVHPSFVQCGAWTGRMSCRRPNMQNVPKHAGKEVRSMFVPRPGYSFIVCDYEGIEIRLLAHYLNDPGFKQLIADGLDPHAWMAANIHGGEIDDYHKDGPNAEIRAAAKNTLFAITYGAGAPRISDMNKISKPEAKALISKIKSSLPGYYRLTKRIKRKIETQGHVTTLFGRKQIVNKDKAYVGVNALIQGSAADIMKQGLVNVNATLAAGPIEASIPLLVVHDEIVVEVPTYWAEQAKPLIDEAMCSAYPLEPQLAVSGSITDKNYAEV